MTTLTDAGKRVADAYKEHRLRDPYGSIGKFFAVNLGDGRSNGTLYDTRRDAVKHTDESRNAYVQVGPWPMSEKDATALLLLHRRAYAAGMRLSDPDAKNGGRDLIPRLTRGDQYRQIAALFGK